MQILFDLLRFWATWFFFQHVNFSTIFKVDIFLVLLVGWCCLWLLPRGTVVMCVCIICFKVMFFIVFIVLFSSSSPQINDHDSQSIPQLNSLGGIFSTLCFPPIVHSSGKALSWDTPTEQMTCEISIFSWVDLTASAYIYDTLRTLINEEFSLDFKNVCSFLGLSGKVLDDTILFTYEVTDDYKH